MRRVCCFVLTISLLLGLGVFASAEEKDWAAAYTAVLEEKAGEVLAGGEDLNSAYSNGYLVYDIDKDGVPELVIKSGTCEADYVGSLYTFSDGEARCVSNELYLGHSSLYSDPGENGLIQMNGHMGYAWAARLSLVDGSVQAETLYEDDLNERLQNDPDADYVYPGDVVPGAEYLELARLELRLPITRYEEIEELRAGRFPEAVSPAGYPQGDAEFFDKIILENREVIAVTADGYTASPGRIAFRDLLVQNVAADWMSADLEILSKQAVDLNGDGQLECSIDLDQGEGSEHMRFFLSEQEGTVYAYLQNYSPKSQTVDRNGNLLDEYSFYTQFSRLLFDGEEAMFLPLPSEYFAA